MPTKRSIVLFTSLSLIVIGWLSLSPVSAEPVSSKPLQIRNLKIGEGQPKIIVSTTGNTADQVLEQGRAAAASKAVDILELRVDLLRFTKAADEVSALGRQLAQTLNGKPLLLTFRSKGEGGAGEMDDAAYTALYGKLLQAGFADLIDVEMRRDEECVRALVVEAHKTGAKVILSSHDLQSTPSDEEMRGRLERQQALGADILKLAVMPRNGSDVIRLLHVTWNMHESSDRPLLTMAMGGTGAISRLGGEAFGSDLTFGSQGEASAPGQVKAEVLYEVLNTLHQSGKS